MLEPPCAGLVAARQFITIYLTGKQWKKSPMKTTRGENMPELIFIQHQDCFKQAMGGVLWLVVLARFFLLYYKKYSIYNAVGQRRNTTHCKSKSPANRERGC